MPVHPQRPGSHKAGVQKVQALERMRQALELRKAGKTFDEIAEQLGYTHRTSAHKAVMTGLKRTLQEPADELRRLESERIDALWSGNWEAAQSGDIDAIRTAVVLMDRRAKLLGLDAPAKADLTSGGQSMAPRVIRVIQPGGLAPPSTPGEGGEGEPSIDGPPATNGQLPGPDGGE